ncbi:MAG TPA: ATP-dependent DNA helicase RecG [Segeticoccus sp.]|uniref:ATP-dependent DNA helicase RecG n=1 Tax=Segeticoccus sp. TaxID=2706531 RepID=UPI002D7F8FA5|nr:ATP-dependent DNA helicase RecG [Segeticoccus sp.]HET8601583.1 ATP-dependent DNA helicase RecG [Segeticoccus sp.]
MSEVGRDTRLSAVVGSAAAKFGKSRDVHSVGDFLDFLPRRYMERGDATDFTHLREGDYAVLVAEITGATTRTMHRRKGRMLTVTLSDGLDVPPHERPQHELLLTFFKPYAHEKRLLPGLHGVFAGKVQYYRGKPQLAHPSYVLFDGRDAGAGALDIYGDGLVPVYLEVPGLHSMHVTELARLVFHALTDLEDPVPAAVRLHRGLVGELEAYRMLHLPHDRDEVKRGLRRLRYDEAFVLQTALAMRRQRAAGDLAVARPVRPGGLREAFQQRLPFELTRGQQEVEATITDDLAREHPMHRLLQGEVGSGKTVVALLAMLTVLDAGGQAALLAPTEVLAAQHHRSITALLGDLAEGGLLGGSEIGTRVALLTGSQPTAQRKEALLQAASGQAGIVVGTHALIQDAVQFADLGLVVVDEQHRFGVEQRDALRGKAERPPHVLVMTATPIPRSVAMTVFGDMETSTLSELPGGRSPITTHVVPTDSPRWVERTWERVAEEVHDGHRAYVVCPRIGDPPGTEAAGGRSEEDLPSDAGGPPMRSVYDVAEELAATPALQGLRLAVLHGRMPADEKDAAMRAFALGDVDVLVSTTVVEVGVDVPAATVMVIVDADRFGVSQLHQLRGRVGRGSAPGLCLLMTGAGEGPGRERLDAVASTTDGFELSRLDLEQRKEGDVLGTAQSGGHRQLRLLRLLRDEDLILAAREDAAEVVADDPDLERHAALRERVTASLDEEQAAFLERG